MLCMCETSLTSSVGQLNLICTTSQLSVTFKNFAVIFNMCVFLFEGTVAKVAVLSDPFTVQQCHYSSL